MTKDYAVVVGGVNLDIGGTPNKTMVLHDSNPGTVRMSLGGVGRNIAHNMALLEVPTVLITALGEDLPARQIADSCAGLGIDLSHALRVPHAATSTYLFLTDHQGEMEMAVSDMEIYNHLTPAFLESKLEVLNGAKLVVCDTNIPAESVEFIARRCTAPVFLDTVSTAKAEKARNVLGKLHTLKPNRIEAALLSGVDIVDEVSLQVAASKLLETGLEQVFISLGGDGVLAANHHTLAHLPIYPGEMKNATGCGDAFMAALAWSFWQDKGLEESAKAGLAAAAIALAGAETINPTLSPHTVAAIMDLHKEEALC